MGKLLIELNGIVSLNFGELLVCKWTDVDIVVKVVD